MEELMRNTNGHTLLIGTSKALYKAEPDEWTIEINLGFKANGGIPFITDGESHGAIKVTARWNRR